MCAPMNKHRVSSHTSCYARVVPIGQWRRRRGAVNLARTIYRAQSAICKYNKPHPSNGVNYDDGFTLVMALILKSASCTATLIAVLQITLFNSNQCHRNVCLTRSLLTEN